MNYFGVIEVASGRTTHAPGWAYVPDSTVPSQSVSSNIAPANRKRAARNNLTGGGSATALSISDVSARHEAKLQKEIDQLNRDNLHRDVSIPVPPKKPGWAGPAGRASTLSSASNNKHASNVRKILVSLKSFANHLDDFEAWRTQAEGSGGLSAVSTPRTASVPSGLNRRPAAASSSAGLKKGGSGGGSRSRVKTPVKVEAPPTPVEDMDADVTMVDAPPAGGEDATRAEPESAILTPVSKPRPKPHPRDSDPLLESWLPPLPTDTELRELINAPPLNYNQAKGVWTEDDRRYPQRYFCEVCGYWGRVKCTKCGTRVCALDCLDVHREECFTRYGI